VFGVSFPELLVVGTVALLVLGPEKLPGMLRTLGQWIAKLRRLTTEVRYQSGIDEVLRAEGFDGGLNELRNIMRGGPAALPAPTYAPRAPAGTQNQHFVPDKSREYPVEGPDSYGALPEDLLPKPSQQSADAGAPRPEPEPPLAAAAPSTPEHGAER
jgi:sec-independent protein translocase protein TatB